jgi:hypothetical protein
LLLLALLLLLLPSLFTLQKFVALVAFGDANASACARQDLQHLTHNLKLKTCLVGFFSPGDQAALVDHQIRPMFQGVFAQAVLQFHQNTAFPNQRLQTVVCLDQVVTPHLRLMFVGRVDTVRHFAAVVYLAGQMTQFRTDKKRVAFR